MRRKQLSNEALYQDYMIGKQTLAQLSDAYHLSQRQIRRRLDKVKHKTISQCVPCEVVVQMDASYWSETDGVLVMKDAYKSGVLWYKFLNKKETVADYKEGIDCLKSLGYDIIGAVGDGLKGLPQMLQDIPFQLCQFHEVKFVRFKLSNHPKTDAGRELLNIAKMMTHTDKESFVGIYEQWLTKWDKYLKERRIGDDGKTHYTHQRLRTAALSIKRNMSHLWTSYDRPELNMPNTNNAMESFFSTLKRYVDNHHGMKLQHKRTFIEAYFIDYNTNKY